MRRLTDGDVISMRKKGDAGARVKDLATEYGVGKGTVSKVLSHKRYSRLGGPKREKSIGRATFLQDYDSMRELVEEIAVRHQ